MPILTTAQCGNRTIKMLKHFLHTDETIRMGDDLRKKWEMETAHFEILKQWIEGPISPSKPGFFEDVNAVVEIEDLRSATKARTVQLLSELIWKGIPHANKR